MYGNGNLNTAEFWEYDTRLGRRWNLDPVFNSSQSQYSTFNNAPILFLDLIGLSGDRGTDRMSKRAAKFATKVGGKIDHDKKYETGIMWVMYGEKDENGDATGVACAKKFELTKGEKLLNGVSNWFAGMDEWVHSDEGEQFGQEVAQFNPAVEAMNVWNGIRTGDNIFNEEMENSDYAFAAITIIPGIGELKGLKYAAKYRKMTKLILAADWATKGAHVKIDGVEVAIKVSKEGVIELKSVFSSTSVHSFEEAAKKVEVLLNDPVFRKDLIHKTEGAIDMFKGGTELERAAVNGFEALLIALKKI